MALRKTTACPREQGAADRADPLAGSYYVEALTNEMERAILAELQRVERMGGIVEAVKSGALQAEVARQAYLFEQKLVSGEGPKGPADCPVGHRPGQGHRQAQPSPPDP